MITPVILAGGSGTRLWPLSRKLYPKQFMSLVDEKTLFQDTLERIKDLDDLGGAMVLCNHEHRFTVGEQLRAIGIEASEIVLEPVGRNTAPALTVAALMVSRTDPAAVLLVLPADHFIGDKTAFLRTIDSGRRFAEKGYLVTFGIVPETPETGYGYIRKGRQLVADMGTENGSPPAWQIDRFVEKPDLPTATEYIESGGYCWNSGMFMFRADTFLAEMKLFAADILAACSRAVEKGKRDLDFFRLDPEAFNACPSDSVDYAVMEKTERGVMVALDSEWNDLGSWEALWQVGSKDETNNVIHGDVCLEDVENCFVHATSRLVAGVGLSNLVVVETKDAVLISPRDRVQHVKKLVERLKRQGRSEALVHKKVYRPWGWYEDVDIAPRFKVKRITVKPGGVLSLQKHFHRAEHWVVVSGTALVTRGEERFILREDESTYIPLGQVHRLENPGKIPLELVEVQSGSYLEEDDIQRLEDVYGRPLNNSGHQAG